MTDDWIISPLEMREKTEIRQWCVSKSRLSHRVIFLHITAWNCTFQNCSYIISSSCVLHWNVVRKSGSGSSSQMISTDASVAYIWHGATFSLPSPTHLNSDARTIAQNYTAAWHQGDESVGIVVGSCSHSSSSSVMLSNEQLLSVTALYELAAWPDLKALGSQMKHPCCAFLIGLLQLPHKQMIIAHAGMGPVILNVDAQRGRLQQEQFMFFCSLQYRPCVKPSRDKFAQVADEGE